VAGPSPTVRTVIRWVFWLLAAFCLWVTWVPDKASLTEETGRVTRVYPHRAWVDVDITTDSGRLLQCSGRSWSKRCPEAAFLELQASATPVTVKYHGKTPYEVTAAGQTIVAYADFRQAQGVLLLVVLLLLGMGYIAGRPQQDD